jgi:hypothetical protein
MGRSIGPTLGPTTEYPMESYQPRLTTAQIGAIGEMVVACQLMLMSSGRLSPFRPLADDDGVNVVLLDKRTRRCVSVAVNARTGLDAGGTVQFDVRRQTFVAAQDGFLIAVLLDRSTSAIAPAWLVPMTELESIAQPDSLTIVPSPKESSRDRYTRYRCLDMVEVTRRLTDYFDRGR